MPVVEHTSRSTSTPKTKLLSGLLPELWLGFLPGGLSETAGDSLLENLLAVWFDFQLRRKAWKPVSGDLPESTGPGFLWVTLWSSTFTGGFCQAYFYLPDADKKQHKHPR